MLYVYDIVIKMGWDISKGIYELVSLEENHARDDIMINEDRIDHRRNYFEHLDKLFKHTRWVVRHTDDLNIEQKGRLLRRTRRALKRMNAQEKSELIIFTLLLPECFKLSSYYKTLPSEMDEKQKALAMRWYLERVSKNPDGAHLREPQICLSIDGRLERALIYFYGRLNKREMFVCKKILYSIWDLGDGYYDHIEESLVKEHKPLFATRRKVYPTIQRLVCALNSCIL
jgi:hypothetical protein